MIQFGLAITQAATPVVPQPAQAAPTSFFSDLVAQVLLRTDLSDATRNSYLGAIERTADRDGRPPSAIPATLEDLETILPADGFDPLVDRTEAAYQLRRRRVQAAIRTFVGFHAQREYLRSLEDDWSTLFALIEPLTKGRIGGSVRFHPMKLGALRSFALTARASGWQPRDVHGSRAAGLHAEARGNARGAVGRCLGYLDALRAFPQLLPLLPSRPIAFRADPGAARDWPLPEAWEEQIAGWVDAVTKSGWDPVSGSFTDDHVRHAHVMRSGLRTSLRIAVDAGLLSHDVTDLRPVLSAGDAQVRIAREMFARRDRNKQDGHLAPRTSRKYIKCLVQVLHHMGADTSKLGLILANNVVAREGRKAEKTMTPKNRRFCEALIDQPHLRRRFLFSFRALREAAERILAVAGAEKRALTGHERARVRLLGAAACFAAIEIGGAPIRVANAVMLTCTGKDAQIRIPGKGKKPIQVLIPAELTKNGTEIRFPIRHNRHGCHDTIRWYLQTVRPLFAHADASRFLFPAVTSPDRHLDPDGFGAEFQTSMRTIVNLPMTPHMMRHGQVSILLHRHPEQVEVIAKRIDDKPETLRTFYGFIKAIHLVERGQDLLMGLME